MDSFDRFGPKIVCSNTCCTVRPTPPCFGPPVSCNFSSLPPPPGAPLSSAFAPYAGLEGGLGYPRPLPPPPGPPLFVDEAPRFIPARENRFCDTGLGCLPVPVAPGWLEVGYVYSVRRRHDSRDDDEDDKESCCGNRDVPCYRFGAAAYRGGNPPTRERAGAWRGRGASAAEQRSGRTRSMSADSNGGFNGQRGGRNATRSASRRPSSLDRDQDDFQVWHKQEKSCGCEGECDCPATVIHNHYYYGAPEGGGGKKERRRDECCLTRRYRLFARTPYGFSCRSLGTTDHFQYAVRETHGDAVLITLDPDPLFRDETCGGRDDRYCGRGTCGRRWQELCTGDLICIPGECVPFRVHLFADDFNPPYSSCSGRGWGYNDGYY